MKSVGKIGLLSGLLLGLSWGRATESSGILEDHSEWFVAGDSSHASPGLGKDNRVNGWIFFGSEKLTLQSALGGVLVVIAMYLIVLKEQK